MNIYTNRNGKNIEKLVLKSNVSELNKIVSFVENLGQKYYLNDLYFANICCINRSL